MWNESIWNGHGIHVESMWNPYGIHSSNYLIYMSKHIPYGIHVESMEYIHSIWIPYGMWGHGKVLPQSAPNQSAASPGQATSNPQRREARMNSHRNPQPIFGPGSEERRSNRRPTRFVYRQSKLRGFTDVHKRRLVCFSRLMGCAKPLNLT
jgi:hypothetical protein